jgi:hypothetical protein
VSRPAISVVGKDRQEGISVGVYANVTMLCRSINAPGMKCRMQKVEIENREMAYAETNQIDQSSLGYPGDAEQKSNTWGKVCADSSAVKIWICFPCVAYPGETHGIQNLGQMLYL